MGYQELDIFDDKSDKDVADNDDKGDLYVGVKAMNLERTKNN